MSIAKSEITRSGQLRRFLLQTMGQLKNGEIDIATAVAIFKLSSQVNESLYAEIKVAQVSQALGGEPNGPTKIGELTISD